MIIKKILKKLIFFNGVFFLIFDSLNPQIYSDSSRYLTGSLLDPPMYSTIIFTMNSLFGSLKSVIFLQALLIGFAITYFVKTISKIINLTYLEKFFVSLIIFLPAIEFYNDLLTEGISYSFSLFFVSFVIRLIYRFNYKNVLLTVVASCALLLTRNQFLFIYPLIFFIFLGVFILQKKIKTLKILLSSFIIILVVHNFFIFVNTYLNQDKINKQYIGNLNNNNNLTDSLTYTTLGPSYFIYIDAIYVSNPDDAKFFKNIKIRNTVEKILKEIDDRKLSFKYYDGRGHFGKSLVNIRDYSNPLLLKLALEENISISSLKREIATKLILKNFKKYIYQIFKKVYDTTWLFVLIPINLLLISLIMFIKKNDSFSLMLVSISLFVLANHSVVYLFGRVQPRYFIYSDFIFLVMIFILFSTIFKKIWK